MIGKAIDKTAMTMTSENLDRNGEDEDRKRKSSDGEEQMRRESRMRSKSLIIS